MGRNKIVFETLATGFLCFISISELLIRHRKSIDLCHIKNHQYHKGLSQPQIIMVSYLHLHNTLQFTSPCHLPHGFHSDSCTAGESVPGGASGRGRRFYRIPVLPQITEKHSRSNQSACKAGEGVGWRKSLIVNMFFIVSLNSTKLFRACFPEPKVLGPAPGPGPALGREWSRGSRVLPVLT